MIPESEFLACVDGTRQRLSGRVEAAKKEFSAGVPFPHVILDGLFDAAVLDRALDEFPGPDGIDWVRFDNPHERKLATRQPEQIGALTRYLIGFLNSSAFIEFVEEITGMSGLISDPHLDGGGLHQIPPGGKLGVHSDFLTHQRLKLDRRLNLIVYLNRDWDEAWGGHLELWDRGMTSCQKRVSPLFNRTVIFTTTAKSFHGHPDPLRCPEGRFRRSIALYYYTNGRPVEEVVGAPPTLFQLRPGEKAKWKARQVIKRFVPPILNDLRYWMKRT